MSRAWRSLHAQLAIVGFLAIYVPVLLVFGVTSLTEDRVVQIRNGVEVASDTSTRRSPWVTWTVVALAPAAAGLAGWWAGRAVRPIDRVRKGAEDIEASDLSRRIGLDHGPAEVVALAASFDAMLARLERAGEVQRRLIEETSHELRTPLSVLATNADVLLAHRSRPSSCTDRGSSAPGPQRRGCRPRSRSCSSTPAGAPTRSIARRPT